MSKANPYESFLDGRPALEIVAATPAELARLIALIGPERAAQAPAPGKWSPAAVLAHLIDCDIAHGWRLRQTWSEENPALQGFDQDRWALNYGTVAAAKALATFTTLRDWNVAFIRAALPTAAQRPAHHSERGDLTFQLLLDTIAGHDLNHIAQLKKLAEPASR